MVPRVTESLKTALEALIGRRAMVVGPGIKTGMNLRVDEPGSVAADLIVGGVAAAAYYGTPAIVVDMGTATTLTVVDKNNCFRGGAIVPGIKLGYNALSAGTSLLPDVSILPPKKVVGSNTVDCMRSGAVFGTAAMIDGMIARMEAELGYPCTVVATGSLAADVIPCCPAGPVEAVREEPVKALSVTSVRTGDSSPLGKGPYASRSAEQNAKNSPPRFSRGGEAYLMLFSSGLRTPAS